MYIVLQANLQQSFLKILFENVPNISQNGPFSLKKQTQERFDCEFSFFKPPIPPDQADIFVCMMEGISIWLLIPDRRRARFNPAALARV